MSDLVSNAERAQLEALAKDELAESARLAAEQLLTSSAPHREIYAKLTRGRYPRVPNYTIIRQVGKGGFGVVYKAVHHAKERFEALKVLFSKTRVLTSYFENEVHLIARLHHANIATLYEAQLEEPPLYYTMEFVEGERLNDFVRNQQLTLADRIHILRTVALAIDHAHAEGVVHRDLKPQNILINASGVPKIVDFGIAQKLAEVGAAQAPETPENRPALGTVGYVAPEQESGRSVDHRADVFSLGALLFHCVTGEPARLARLADQRQKILNERNVAHARDLSDIIARCVAEDPADRYASAAEFAADLENYLEGRPVTAPGSRPYVQQAARIGALLLRNYPLAVRSSVVVTIAALLTSLFSALGARVATEPTGLPPDQVTLIGFTEDTLEAMRSGEIGADLPGLDPNPFTGRRSWRLLHGRLMERLALAAPSVVAWDYFFPAESEFDDAMARGIRALAPCPVIFAAKEFYEGGEPQITPTIGEHAHACGIIYGTNPDASRFEYEIVYCHKRGIDDPIPSLAIATWAAAKYPECVPELAIRPEAEELYVRFELRDPQPFQSRFRGAEQLPLQQIVRIREDDPRVPLMLRHIMKPGDVLAHARIRAMPQEFWEVPGRVVAYHDVLTASRAQLRNWFHNRAVLIGQMMGQADLHRRQTGAEVYGCQVHADAINALFGPTRHERIHRSALLVRCLGWSLAAALVTAVVARRRWPPAWISATFCFGFALSGALFGASAVVSVTDPALVEASLAASALASAGGVLLWTKIVRDQQLVQLPSSPEASLFQPEQETTVLAET